MTKRFPKFEGGPLDEDENREVRRILFVFGDYVPFTKWQRRVLEGWALFGIGIVSFLGISSGLKSAIEILGMIK